MLHEGLQLGQYQLRRLIGRGGAGDVYLAEDQRITRQVAIKIVQSEDPNNEVSREAARRHFYREAQTIAMLSHANILPLFDFGEQVIDGTTLSYLVIPFCQEGSLVTWIRQRNGPPILPHEVIYIVQQAASALEYAHDRDVIHRDVKPANFLVRSRKDTPDRPDMLLTDFGIARLTSGTGNASKTIRGTPKYMAPEQWKGDAVPATDQYALATMAYELLAGRLPFVGTQEEVMYHHLMIQPQPPSTFNLRLSPAVDVVLLRALSKQPEARFPSISGFANALQQAVQPAVTPSITPVNLPPLSYPYAVDASNPPSNPPLQLSTLPSVSHTPHISISDSGKHSDFYTMLTISSTEAETGVTHTLTLPGKQKIKITIPPGAYDGQVIRLDGQVDAAQPNAQKGDIIVTIAVTPTVDAVIIEPISDTPHVDWKTSLLTHINWKTYVLFGFVLLILLAGVVGFSFLGINLFPATNKTQAVTGASNSSISALQSSSSTATASAAAQQTATAQSNATAVTTNLYDSTLKTLALNEPLNKNNTSRWDEIHGSCSFAAGNYQVINMTQTTASQVCIAHNTNFRDFAFEVQMNILKGDGGGILLRSSGTTSYYFRISQGGYYALLVCATAGTSCEKILTGAFSAFITTGRNQTNLIAVEAKGNRIELYVNNQRIDGVNDNSSLSGQIGVVAEAGSEVVFSNAKVWTP